MEDYIPQDEYFEWEDIMQSRSYDSATFADHSSYLSLPSQYQTSFSEKQATPEIKGFQWSSCDYEGPEKEDIAKSKVTVSQSAVSWDEPIPDEKGANTMEIPTFEDMEYDTEEWNLSGYQQPLVEETQDDIKIMEHPSRNVDFLSHKWQERDIWSTRKYLRSSMQEHENIARWENACWRSSAMLRLRLPPVCPLTFNWMRDQDDTWLYGPFKGIPKEADDHGSNERPIKSILKDPCVSELLLRGSITTCDQRKQLSVSLRCSKERSSIRFSEEVEQYCVAESDGSEWAGEDEDCVWIAPRTKSRSRNTVFKVASTTLRSEPSRKVSQPPRTPLFREEASLRSTSTISEWMWLSGDDEDGDDIDWITAAANRTSAALKAASEPPPVFEGSAIKEANSRFLKFSGVQYPQPPSSSKEEDDMEAEYLLACDQLESESASPDQSDYQSSSSSDDQDEEVDGYFDRSGLLDRKNMIPKVGVIRDEDTALYEQMMEEFNLILG